MADKNDKYKNAQVELKIKFISGHEFEITVKSDTSGLVNNITGISICDVPVLLNYNTDSLTGVSGIPEIPSDGKYSITVTTRRNVLNIKELPEKGKVRHYTRQLEFELKLICSYYGLEINQQEYDDCKAMLSKKAEYDSLGKYEKLFKNIVLFLQSAIGFDTQYYNVSTDEAYIMQEYVQLGSNIFNYIETAGIDFEKKEPEIPAVPEPDILMAGRKRLLSEMEQNRLVVPEIINRRHYFDFINDIYPIINNYKSDDDDKRPVETGRSTYEIKETIHTDALKLIEIFKRNGFVLTDFSDELSPDEKDRFFNPNGRTALKYSVPAVIRKDGEKIKLIAKGMHEEKCNE